MGAKGGKEKQRGNLDFRDDGSGFLVVDVDVEIPRPAATYSTPPSWVSNVWVHAAAWLVQYRMRTCIGEMVSMVWSDVGGEASTTIHLYSTLRLTVGHAVGGEVTCITF